MLHLTVVSVNSPCDSVLNGSMKPPLSMPVLLIHLSMMPLRSPGPVCLMLRLSSGYFSSMAIQDNQSDTPLLMSQSRVRKCFLRTVLIVLLLVTKVAMRNNSRPVVVISTN